MLGRSLSVSCGREVLKPKDLATISRKRVSITLRLVGCNIIDLKELTIEETKPTIFINVRGLWGVLR